MIDKRIKGGEEVMMFNLKRGQSMLEYTLILGAVIAVIVVVLLSTGGVKDKIQNAYNTTGTALQNTTNDIGHGVFR